MKNILKHTLKTKDLIILAVFIFLVCLIKITFWGITLEIGNPLEIGNERGFLKQFDIRVEQGEGFKL